MNMTRGITHPGTSLYDAGVGGGLIFIWGVLNLAKHRVQTRWPSFVVIVADRSEQTSQGSLMVLGGFSFGSEEEGKRYCQLLSVMYQPNTQLTNRIPGRIVPPIISLLEANTGKGPKNNTLYPQPIHKSPPPKV
jgi:hypothetical protein